MTVVKKWLIFQNVPCPLNVSRVISLTGIFARGKVQCDVDKNATRKSNCLLPSSFGHGHNWTHFQATKQVRINFHQIASFLFGAKNSGRMGCSVFTESTRTIWAWSMRKYRNSSKIWTNFTGSMDKRLTFSLRITGWQIGVRLCFISPRKSACPSFPSASIN